MKFIPLAETYYGAFYALVQSTQWGNPMLPVAYNDSLWGILMQDSSETIVGGWVGTLRGNAPMVRCIAKSVYFDSYPVFRSPEDEAHYLPLLLDAVKQYAHKQHIVMLNLTHWVRGQRLPLDIPSKEATFCTPLHTTVEQLWKMVESKQRNCIRKGEKNGVEVDICQGEDSLRYLSDFQRLRQSTQQHAIRNHTNASMLLKSNDFFAAKFTDPKATLFVARVEGQTAAVALMLQSGRTVYYYSGGSDYELNRKYSCSAYLLWRAICHYNDLGLDTFDMGGVPQSPTVGHPAYGVYVFKRSFGGTYQEFDGGKIVISPTKYRLLNFLLSQRKLLRLFSKRL
ncbi:MAG: lipid II:glycine glycyltransferase FemX [Paludibacteraceae bacterium]